MRKDRIMDRHDRGTTFHPESHVDDNSGHRTADTVVNNIGFAVATIDDPDTLIQNPFILLPVHASQFANGITVTDCGIITHPSSTYSVDFKKYTSPSDGSPVTIETVATSASQEAEDDGTINNPDIDAGDIIYVNLPATDIDQLCVWVTFTID